MLYVHELNNTVTLPPLETYVAMPLTG